MRTHLILASLKGKSSKSIARSVSKNFSFHDYQILDRWEKLKELGYFDLTILDEAYPDILLHISNPPIVLYGLGDISLLKTFSLSIVGSRKPSNYGLKQARKIAYDLAKENVTIVSGMALGIDGQSHWGALDAGGSTIAILGSGINRAYPKRHLSLYQKIAEHGLILSEYPPDSLPLARHFPERNRIIAGLSYGTLVVEAKIRSGTMITAKYAAEEGREVFALPGDITREESQGPHYLISNGAKLVSCIEDILLEFKEKGL